MEKKIVLDLIHNGNKKRFSFMENSFTIGRSKNNQVHIKDGHFSRVHLKVKRSGAKLFIADNNTTNGTFVNGVKLPAGKYHEISHEDKIRFGNTKFFASFTVHQVVTEKKEKQEKGVTELSKLQKIDELRKDDRLLENQKETDSESTLVNLKAEETAVHVISDENDDNLEHDISKELSLDDYKLEEDDDTFDQGEESEGLYNEEEFDKELVSLDDEDIYEDDVNDSSESDEETKVFTLSEDDLEDIREEELEFAVDNICLNNVNESDLLREVERPIVRQPEPPKENIVAQAPTPALEEIGNTENVSLLKSSDELLASKVDIQQQIKNISQVKPVEVPEINVNPQEVLNEIESENELAEIHQLQFEQKKIEAQLVSLKLISDAEKKAETILNNAKKFEDELYSNYESETKRIEAELESIRKNYNDEKESVYQQKSELYKKFEAEKHRYHEELKDLEEKKRHIELEYGSLQELVDEADTELRSKKNEYEVSKNEFLENKKELEKNIKDLNDEIRSKEKDLDNAKNDFNKKIDVYENDLESKRKLIAILVDEKESLDKHIKELNLREEKKHQDYDHLNSRIDDLYKDRERLEESLAKHKADLTLVETKIDNLNKESEIITRNIEEKKAEAIAERERYAEDLKSYKENIENKKRNYDEELAIYKESIEQKKNNVNEELSRLKRDKEFEIEELERTHQETIKSLKEEIELLQEELSTGKVSIDKEIEEYRTLLQEEAEEEASRINDQIKDLKDTTAKEYESFKKHREKEEGRIKDFEKSVKARCEKLEAQTTEKCEKLEEQIQEKCRKIEISSIETKNEILSEAKKTSEDLISDSRHKADEILRAARSQEEQISEKAKDEARSFVENARERLDKANSQSERIINEAQEKALHIQETNLKDIKEKREGLQSEADSLKSEIEQEQENLEILKNEYRELQDNMEAERGKIKEELEFQIKEKKKEAQEIYDQKVSEATASAKAIVDKAKAEYESGKLSFNKKLEAEKKEGIQKLEEEFDNLQSEFNTKLENEKKMLAKLRAAETENIKKMRKEVEDDLKEKKNNAISDIADSIEKLVILELKESHDVDAATIKHTASRINQMVHDNFAEGNVKGKGVFDKLNPYGSIGKGRSNEFWLKLGIGAGIVIVLLLSYVIFPSFYGGISESVSEAVKVEESAQKIYLDKIKEERSNRPTWSPDTDNKFRYTYTSNVLYTKDFASKWLSDDFQADWTLEVDNVFINELDLSESKVVSFVSEEFKLVRDLQDIREKIRLETEETRIEEMKALEKSRLEKIYEILDGEENYEKLSKFKREFWSSKLNK